MSNLVVGPSLPAVAVEWDFGFANTGAEQVAVMFRITEGEFEGRCLTWHGYFTEATEERTLEALMYCGWDGEDIEKLNGMGSQPVSLVVDIEEYDGKERSKVQWVNRPASLALKTRMDDGQRASFAQRMRAKAAAVKQRTQRNSTAFSPAAADDDRPPM